MKGKVDNWLLAQLVKEVKRDVNDWMYNKLKKTVKKKVNSGCMHGWTKR